MDKCAWCKKENINPSGWSKNKEPLCLECVCKYNFGINEGMILGSVSDLSKEQRREISEKVNSFERFWRATRSVEREILIGRPKILSYVCGWSLFILFLTILYLQDWLQHSLWGFVFIGFFIVSAYWLHNRIAWNLKYYQLKKKVKESGYRGI